MPFSVSDFRLAIGTPDISKSEFITVKEDALSGVTSKPTDKDQLEQVRTALFDSLKPLGGGDNAFEATLSRLIYGKNDELKGTALTKLEARNIIDHAEAISGRLARQLGRTLLTGNFPPNVMKMLQRTVIDQANNPVVRNYLAGNCSYLTGLGAVASLAKSVFANAKDLTQEELCAVSYLDGFAARMGVKDVKAVESNPLMSADETKASVAAAFKDGGDMAGEQIKALGEMKNKVFSGAGNTDDFLRLLDYTAEPEGEDRSLQSQIGNVKVGGISCKLKESDPDEKKFDQVENSGAGKNCLFYSMAHLLMGKEKASRSVAYQMRRLCTVFAESLQKDSKGWKALEDDSSLSLMLKDADLGGLKPNPETNESQQVDMACVQLLSHLTRRPITVVTTDVKTKEMTVKVFDTDLKTGKKLCESEEKSSAQMLYLHYDMYLNRQEKVATVPTTEPGDDKKDVASGDDKKEVTTGDDKKDGNSVDDKKEVKAKPVKVAANGHFTALVPSKA